MSVELVTADGEVTGASADENPDLFWAIRGGGGNFGIVTSLEYQLHPIGQILSGNLTYPISDLRAVLTFLDEYMMSIPDELDMLVDIGNPAWMAGVNAEPVVNLTASYCGDVQRGEAVLKPLRSFRKPAADGIRAMSYLEMQELVDLRPLLSFCGSGGSTALETGFIERLGQEAIDRIEASIAEAPACFWVTADHYLHGAVLRPAPEHTAFALRRRAPLRIFAAWRSK